MNNEKRSFKCAWIATILIYFLIVISACYADQTFSRVTINTGIKVIYDEFSGENTTDFLHISDEQLENISNLTLEIPEHGKIVFDGEINLTKDAKNKIINLNENIDIFQNKIWINSFELESLKTPAVLLLKNVSFSNPRVLKNGIVCPVYTCNIVSYSNRVLIFRVNLFENSSYSAEEIPTTSGDVSFGGGGGGGGGGGEASPNLNNASPKPYKNQAVLNSDESETEKINNENKTTNASISEIEKPFFDSGKLSVFLVILALVVIGAYFLYEKRNYLLKNLSILRHYLRTKFL